jgi:hypothetical protein
MKDHHRFDELDAMDRRAKAGGIRSALGHIRIAAVQDVDDMLRELHEPVAPARGVLLRHVCGMGVFDDNHAPHRGRAAARRRR